MMLSAIGLFLLVFGIRAPPTVGIITDSFMGTGIAVKCGYCQHYGAGAVLLVGRLLTRASAGSR